MLKRNVQHRSASTYHSRLGAKLALLLSLAILISSLLPGMSGTTQTILAAASSSPHTIASPTTARARASAAQTATARQDARSTTGRRMISAQQKRLAALRQTGKPELLAEAAQPMRRRIAPQAVALVTGVVKLPSGATVSEPQEVWLMSALDDSY